MNKLIILSALFALSTVVLSDSGCNVQGYSKCTTSFTSCAVDTSGTPAICGCFGNFTQCLNSTGCIYTGLEWKQYIDNCEAQGCTVNQCTSTPYPCNGELMSQCTTDWVDCLLANKNNPCKCYGKFYVCWDQTGCQTTAQKKQFLSDCTASGCSQTACTTTSKGCDTDALTQCAVDWSTCVLGANLNKDKICSCNGKYAKCWYHAKCATGIDYQNYLDVCVKTDGCTLAQCEGNSLLSWLDSLQV